MAISIQRRAFIKTWLKEQRHAKETSHRDRDENIEATFEKLTERNFTSHRLWADLACHYRHVLEMIGILREAGYPAVLGVITETDSPDPENMDL